MENINSYCLSCGNRFFTTLIILISFNYYWSLVILAAQKHLKCRCILRGFCAGLPVHAAQAIVTPYRRHKPGSWSADPPIIRQHKGFRSRVARSSALRVAIHRSSVPHHTPVNQPAHKVSVQLFRETGSALWFSLGGTCEAWWFTQPNKW